MLSSFKWSRLLRVLILRVLSFWIASIFVKCISFSFACGIEESLGLRLPVSIYALKDGLGPACKAAFLAAAL
jgi:hypothetical protein